MHLNCGVGEDYWEPLRLQGDQNSQSQRKSVLNIHWKDWCWSSNSLTTWCEELIHWKRSWCWERLNVGEEGDYREWDGWMASPTRKTWVWASSGSWWWTEKPSMLQTMVTKSQTQLSNWPELEQHPPLCRPPGNLSVAMKRSFPHHCSARSDALPEDLAVSSCDLSQGSRSVHGCQRRWEPLELQWRCGDLQNAPWSSIKGPESPKEEPYTRHV